jgi:thymidylate synthase (FAD)
MIVKLFSFTPEPVATVVTAAKVCYSGDSIENIHIAAWGGPYDANRAFLQKLKKAGHLSPFEHASFTFSIEGVSRVTTHQLVRHRLASYSQRSQRYVKDADNNCVMPPSIAVKEEAAERFQYVTDWCLKEYNKLLEMGIPKEDARYLLPHGMESSIVVTMNARALLHFFELRLAPGAQWEIKELAHRMRDCVMAEAEEIFGDQ